MLRYVWISQKPGMNFSITVSSAVGGTYTEKVFLVSPKLNLSGCLIFIC